MSASYSENCSIESAIAFGEELAKRHMKSGGDVSQLFGAFLGVVVSEDQALGYRCMIAVDEWLTKKHKQRHES